MATTTVFKVAKGQTLLAEKATKAEATAFIREQCTEDGYYTMWESWGGVFKKRMWEAYKQGKKVTLESSNGM